jgi:aspartate racemase
MNALSGGDGYPWISINSKSSIKRPGMRTIGLIGGMSWESSAEYYRLINAGIRDQLGPLRSASMLMHSVDFGPIALAQREGRWSDAGDMLAMAARSLEAGGAGCVVLCTNTMHKVAAQIEAAVSIPFLHIADPVGRAATLRDWKMVGLLGTAFTMEESFLKDRLAERYGINVLTPPAHEREVVHQVIYEELCAGVISGASRRRYQTIIDRLAARGAEAVILGCTEITLLIKPSDASIPLLDTTPLHASAAIDFALDSTA